jgi:hypothetical protein
MVVTVVGRLSSAVITDKSSTLGFGGALSDGRADGELALRFLVAGIFLSASGVLRRRGRDLDLSFVWGGGGAVAAFTLSCIVWSPSGVLRGRDLDLDFSLVCGGGDFGVAFAGGFGLVVLAAIVAYDMPSVTGVNQ